MLPPVKHAVTVTIRFLERGTQVAFKWCSNSRTEGKQSFWDPQLCSGGGYINCIDCIDCIARGVLCHGVPLCALQPPPSAHLTSATTFVVSSKWRLECTFGS
eukprot:1181752-Prorocentrum_minimum.AAC.1